MDIDNAPQLEADSCNDERLIVETFDREGRLVERFVGPSREELLEAHTSGRCAATCAHCHQALADEIGEDDALRAMFTRAFGKPPTW